jgi:hypothetical protein
VGSTARLIVHFHPVDRLDLYRGSPGSFSDIRITESTGIFLDNPLIKVTYPWQHERRPYLQGSIQLVSVLFNNSMGVEHQHSAFLIGSRHIPKQAQYKSGISLDTSVCRD